MTNIGSNAPNIFHFEKRFHEMIYEIQRNTKELNNLEKERFLIHEKLCSTNSLLQNERKISNELKIRLQLASETIKHLEEEKMRDKINYSNLLMNYESVFKERDILKEETLFCQTEVVKFKFKIEDLENTLLREIRQKEKLEQALSELKSDNEKIIANIDMNIIKIAKEQKYLLESAKGIIQLNKRLQTFGLCFHAINEKNKANIKSLQHKLIALSINKTKLLSNNEILHPEIEKLCFKLKETLIELRLKIQNSASFEEKLNKIFNELSANLTSDTFDNNNL